MHPVGLSRLCGYSGAYCFSLALCMIGGRDGPGRDIGRERTDTGDGCAAETSLPAAMLRAVAAFRKRKFQAFGP